MIITSPTFLPSPREFFPRVAQFFLRLRTFASSLCGSRPLCIPAEYTFEILFIKSVWEKIRQSVHTISLFNLIIKKKIWRVSVKRVGYIGGGDTGITTKIWPFELLLRRSVLFGSFLSNQFFLPPRLLHLDIEEEESFRLEGSHVWSNVFKKRSNL